MQTKKKEGESEFTFFMKNVGAASFAGMVAEAVSITTDTAKVRMQVQKIEPGVVPRYTGLMQTIGKISSQESPMALFNGLSAGLQRQFIFAGLRIGLYVPVRDMVTGPLPEGVNPSMF